MYAKSFKPSSQDIAPRRPENTSSLAELCAPAFVVVGEILPSRNVLHLESLELELHLAECFDVGPHAWTIVILAHPVEDELGIASDN